MNTTVRLPRGLYVITPQRLCADTQALLAAAGAALAGGAVMLQYRDKQLPGPARLAQAQALRALCHAQGARFIINDDVTLAAACGADGVHLGREDGRLADARRQLGAEAILGASCGPSVERAREALAEGADYVAFGRFFPSTTKPTAPGADLECLADARRCLPSAHLCAIGGITPTQAPLLHARGADLIAVVEGVFGSDDITAAAAAIAALYR